MKKLIFLSALLIATCTVPTIIGIGGTANAQIISAGMHHSIVRCDDGTIRTTGSNFSSQLGVAGPDQYTPVQPPIIDITDVSAGSGHTMVLKNDSTVWSFGSNTFGQLGDGTNTTSVVPVMAVGLSNIIAIVAAVSPSPTVSHSMALKDDGTVWTWGDNNSGQLGDGTTTDSNIPLQVAGLSNVIAIAAGVWHSLALKSDGTIWAWGYNASGQLGDGTTTDSWVPVQVSGMTNAISVVSGSEHSMAIKNNGTVWAWGSNIVGELGDGTTNNSNVPVQVTGLSNPIGLDGGGYYSVAVKNNNTYWAWGSNSKGQYGNGTTNESLTPTQVLTGVGQVSTGSGYTLFAYTNGEVWGTGNNPAGALGDLSAIDRDTPVKMLLTGCPVTPPVGINQLANDNNQIIIYPNPTDGKFKVEGLKLKVEKVQVYDLFGRKVLESKEQEIDMSSYPAGLYIWRVGNTRGKIVIE